MSLCNEICNDTVNWLDMCNRKRYELRGYDYSMKTDKTSYNVCGVIKCDNTKYNPSSTDTNWYNNPNHSYRLSNRYYTQEAYLKPNNIYNLTKNDCDNNIVYEEKIDDVSKPLLNLKWTPHNFNMKLKIGIKRNKLSNEINSNVVKVIINLIIQLYVMNI